MLDNPWIGGVLGWAYRMGVAIVSWGGGAIPGAVGGTVGTSTGAAAQRFVRYIIRERWAVRVRWPRHESPALGRIVPSTLSVLPWCFSHGLTPCFELAPACPRPSGDGGRWHRPHRHVHAVPGCYKLRRDRRRRRHHPC